MYAENKTKKNEEANLGLQKVELNQSKSKTHCTRIFVGLTIINQNLIFITNSKNTAILS